ncbi:hypothetical protein OIU35_19035 [Boseaceae bacterium BT-24-1]|nr:hypothetical protein [Boseaceae bacterium BT-24-1]
MEIVTNEDATVLKHDLTELLNVGGKHSSVPLDISAYHQNDVTLAPSLLSSKDELDLALAFLGRLLITMHSVPMMARLRVIDLDGRATSPADDEAFASIKYPLA